MQSKASDAIKKFPKYAPQSKLSAAHVEEAKLRFQHIMENKLRNKKAKPSKRTLKKREMKKLKKSNGFKKQVVSAAKSIKNEKIKEEKGVNGSTEDVKPDIKPDVKPEKVFNEEGKIVFSKFEFAARPSQAKKSKKDSKFCE